MCVCYHPSILVVTVRDNLYFVIAIFVARVLKIAVSMAAAKEVAVRVVADERGESSEWNQDSNLCRENANRWKRSIGSHYQTSS